MALRVVYRSYGGENYKDRPEGYSKLLCLQSFVRALENVDLDVLYVNDGPVPDEVLELQRATGRVHELPGVGMRGSYWSGLNLATTQEGWDDHDVVWFSEDDYLYAADSLSALEAAIDELPADYFALYGSTPGRSVHGPDEPESGYPRRWQPLGPYQVGDRSWVRLRSTASTFGARIGPLRQDLGIFRLCMVPHKNMYRDHDTCLTVQGYAPYGVYELAHPLYERGASLKDRVRHAAILPFYVATALRALRRPSRRRVYLAVAPNLATHMENKRLAPGTDWNAVADDVRTWATQRQQSVATGTSR